LARNEVAPLGILSDSSGDRVVRNSDSRDLPRFKILLEIAIRDHLGLRHNGDEEEHRDKHDDGKRHCPDDRPILRLLLGHVQKVGSILQALYGGVSVIALIHIKRRGQPVDQDTVSAGPQLSEARDPAGRARRPSRAPPLSRLLIVRAPTRRSVQRHQSAPARVDRRGLVR